MRDFAPLFVSEFGLRVRWLLSTILVCTSVVHFGRIDPSRAGGSLAEFFYKRWNGDCPKVEEIQDREKIVEDAKNCGLLQKTLTARDFGKISELAVLGGLAGERAESLECSANQVSATLSTPEVKNKILQDAMEKIRDIAKDRDAMKTLSQVMDNRTSPLAQLDGKGSVHDEYRKLRARSQAALESISFVELPEQRAAIEAAIMQLQAFDGREIPASTLESIKTKLGNSLATTRDSLNRDLKIMKDGSQGVTGSLSTNQRESLLQDGDLVESYLKRNKESEQALKSISCRLDAKYGKGANYRDVTLMVGSTLITGPGWATLGKVGLSAIRATQLATRGVAAARSARVLKYTALAIGETANLGVTIGDIHKACDAKAGHFGGHIGEAKAGAARSCDTNVVKALDANNCYLAYGLGAIGAVGTAGVAYSQVTERWANQVGKVVEKSVRSPSAADAKSLSAGDREVLSQGLEDLKFKAPAQDLKVGDALEPVVLSANEVRKGGIANYMQKSKDRGVEYVFDDAKFAGKSDLVLSEGNRIFLRRKEGLHQLDSAQSRESIVRETEKVLGRMQCEKTRSVKDCSRAIAFTAGYDSKFNLTNREREFVSGDREALYKGGRMSRNPESIAAAEKMAEEEALVLAALKTKWVNGLGDNRDETRKVLKETVHLSDGREIEVELPYGAASDFPHFKSLVDQRLNEAPIKSATDRIKSRNEAWMERRKKLESKEMAPYKPGYKIENGRVISEYQPTRVIPRSSYPSQRTDAKYGGRIFRSLDEIKKFRDSNEWRDGVHVFLQILEKDKNGKDVPVWMESHRIPNGKDFEDGKIITHRTLAAEYERQTGQAPRIIDGGEYLADATRTLKQVGDGMGGFHDKEVFAPTAYFAADNLHAQGLKFAPPTEVSEGTRIQPFKASDGNSQMVGHYKAADEVRKAREIERTYPGLFKKNQDLAPRALENERKFLSTQAQLRAFVVKYLNSPDVRANPEKFEAYRLISNLSKLMPESSTMATIQTVEGLHLHPKLKRDIPGALKLIDKYVDEYFQDMERVSKTSAPQ